MSELRRIDRCPECGFAYFDPVEGSCRWCHWRPATAEDEAQLEAVNPRRQGTPMRQSTTGPKARRLVRDGAVEVTSIDENVVVATVTGEHNTYRVTRSHDGTFEGCSCPAVARCAHIEAVALTTKEEPMTSYTPDDTQRPFTDENEPEAETAGPDLDVDPETGEILDESEDTKGAELEEEDTAAPAEIVPAEVVDRNLLPLTEAPVTYRTLQTIARTDFVPAALRGRPEAVLAAVLYGRELGLEPMQSLAHIDVIDGRPSPSAELTARLVRAAGHKIEVLAATDQVCTLRGTRVDTGETMEVTFTIEDAARVTTKENGNRIALSETKRYREYPGDMLWARAVTRLARRLFPDVQGLNDRNPAAQVLETR